MDPFSVLPPEIGTMITNHMDEQTQLNCRLVCKSWKEAFFDWTPVARRSVFREELDKTINQDKRNVIVHGGHGFGSVKEVMGYKDATCLVMPSLTFDAADENPAIEHSTTAAVTMRYEPRRIRRIIDGKEKINFETIGQYINEGFSKIETLVAPKILYIHNVEHLTIPWLQRIDRFCKTITKRHFDAMGGIRVVASGNLLSYGTGKIADLISCAEWLNQRPKLIQCDIKKSDNITGRIISMLDDLVTGKNDDLGHLLDPASVIKHSDIKSYKVDQRHAPVVTKSSVIASRLNKELEEQFQREEQCDIFHVGYRFDGTGIVKKGISRKLSDFTGIFPTLDFKMIPGSLYKVSGGILRYTGNKNDKTSIPCINPSSIKLYCDFVLSFDSFYNQWEFQFGKNIEPACAITLKQALYVINIPLILDLRGIKDCSVVADMIELANLNSGKCLFLLDNTKQKLKCDKSVLTYLGRDTAENVRVTRKRCVNPNQKYLNSKRVCRK